MAPFVNQLSLPYNNTDFTTALYSIPHARTVAPVFVANIPIADCVAQLWKCRDRKQWFFVHSNIYMAVLEEVL